MHNSLEELEFSANSIANPAKLLLYTPSDCAQIEEDFPRMGCGFRLLAKSRQTMFGTRLFLVMIALLAVCPGCGIQQFSATRDFQETVKVDGPLVIKAATSNGGIQLTTHDEPEVRLVAHLKAFGTTTKAAEELLEKLDPTVKSDDKEVLIEAPKLNGFYNYSISYEIFAPKKSTLLLKTSNGGVETVGEFASIGIATSNGTVKVDGGSGIADLTSSNGAVHVKNFEGQVLAKTSNGRIEMDRCVLSEDSTAETSNGRIVVGLTEQSSIRLSAKTSNGRVQCEVPFEASGDQSKTRIGGIAFPEATGEKKVSLALKTSNGGIEIKKASAMDRSEEPRKNPEPTEPPKAEVDEI